MTPLDMSWAFRPPIKETWGRYTITDSAEKPLVLIFGGAKQDFIFCSADIFIVQLRFFHIKTLFVAQTRA
ncbi:MAG: hypothetical protein NTY45_12140, partial [Elusimicrobia bacterium]|nr:hypothetical protein [Elusimicrobiota bacterium]